MRLFDRIFRRDRDDEESEDLSIYKTEEPTTNRFASLLFGFFALLVTLVIAGGIFFGGRAVYRTLNGDSDTGSQVSTPSDNSGNNPQPAASSSKPSTTKKKTSTKKPGHTPSTGDNLPNTGDSLTLPKTGDPGM